MHYPAAVEIGSDSEAIGVVIPDLPGCISAGDTLGEALDNASELARAWLADMCEIPTPSTIEQAKENNPDLADWQWVMIFVKV